MRRWVVRLRASVEAVSPQQVALLLSVGLVLGVFPIMGCPTVLCVVAAMGLRLNLAALQLLNNLSSPLQFALLLPLTRVGASICWGVTGGTTVAGKLAAAALHAVTGWACICVPLGILLYAVLTVAMRKRSPLWFNSAENAA